MARPMTLEELQAALRNAARPEQHDDGFLVSEIETALGISTTSARKLVRQGLDAGTVRRSTRITECIDGRVRPAPSYIFLDGSA